MPKDHFYSFANILSMMAVIIIYLIWDKKMERQELIKCSAEEQLQFSGVVTHYETDTKKETSTFCLNEQPAVYKIPRSSKEVFVRNEDSIFKLAGQHVYIVKRYLAFPNPVDTFRFSCEQ